MEPRDYFNDDYNIIEKSVEDIRNDCYKDFMETLNSVINIVSIFPSEWHLKMLKGIMQDI